MTVEEKTKEESESTIATLTAETLLIDLKIVRLEVAQCVAMARDSVSLSAIQEGNYERAMAVYMGLLGLAGKLESMIAEITPDVQCVVVSQALADRDRTNATCH